MPRVLFVDDDCAAVGDTIAMMHDEGFDVIPCGSVDEALASAKANVGAVDAIILDLLLPPGDLLSSDETWGGRATGLVLYTQYLQPLFPKTPVVVLTAVSDPQTLERARAIATVVAVLSRPVRIEVLLNALRLLPRQ